MKLRKLLVLLLLLGAAFILSACGKDGVQGETGDQGPKGETGAQGTKGTTGEDGDPGAKGEQGANGVGIQFSYGSEGILWRYIGSSEWNTGVYFEDLFKFLKTDTIKFDYYVDQSLTLNAGDPIIAHGNNLEFGKNAFSSVGSALAAIKAASAESGYKGAVLFLEAGVYEDAITVDFDGLTIKGANTGLTLVHDSEFDVSAKENTVLTAKLTVAADDFTLRGVVTKNQIVANAVENLTLKEIVLTENTSNGIVEFNGANENVTIDKVYTCGKSGNRSFYVYGSIKNFTVRRCVLMDNCKSVYDWVRISASTEARLYGDVLLEYNYVAQTNQSGFMDRVPTASNYTIRYNVFNNIPAAIYFRNATVANMNYVLENNTFENCGDIPSDWDVVAFTTSDTTNLQCHHNNFIDCLSTSGSNTDYIFNIRSAAGTIDCSDNFCNNETTKTMNKNATGLTWAEAAFDLPEMPVDKFNDDKYEALFDKLAAEFVADFNTAATLELSDASEIDTDHMSSTKLKTFMEAEGMGDKWNWLFSAIANAAEAPEKAPEAADFTWDANLSFYFPQLCGLFTMTQHKDTWFETESLDFTDVALVESILDQYVAPVDYDALLATLAAEFVTDFNTVCGLELGSASELDTNFMGSSKVDVFGADATMSAKWGWLYEALTTLSGEASHSPKSEGFTWESNRGFYLANINGLFTKTAHKDTWLETQGMDFTVAANVKTVLDAYLAQ